MSKRSSRVLAVSVPPELARDVEAIADAEGRNRSELFREMFRVYRAYREVGELETLQRYGAARGPRGGGQQGRGWRPRADWVPTRFELDDQVDVAVLTGFVARR